MNDNIITVESSPEKSCYMLGDTGMQLIVSTSKATYNHLVQYGSDSYNLESRETDAVEMKLLCDGNLVYKIYKKGYTDGYASYDRVMQCEYPYWSKKVNIEKEIAKTLYGDNSDVAFVVKTFLSKIESNSLVAEIKQNLDSMCQQRIEAACDSIRKCVKRGNIRKDSSKDSQKEENDKEKFMIYKDMLSEHPEQLSQCLKSMCTIYANSKDQNDKQEMLIALYNIRKGAATKSVKRKIAHTFKSILDEEPELQKNEYLVALSRVDTLFSTPTDLVKTRVGRCL